MMAKNKGWNSTLGIGKTLERRTHLESRTPLKNTTPLKPRGNRWYRRKTEGLVYGPYHDHVGMLQCIINNDECWGAVSGHHVDPVGGDGKDKNNEVPLCEYHHIWECHEKGQPWFENEYSIDLKAIARKVWKEYQEG